MDTGTLNALFSMFPVERLKDKSGNFVDRWRTCPVRLAFAALAAPKTQEGDDGDRLQYGVSLLFPGNADISVLKAAVREAAVAKFGPGVAPASLTLPFHDQAAKAAKYGGFTTGVYLNVSSQHKPVVLGPDATEINAESVAVYSGMWALVKLNCYAWEKKGKRGVSFGLLSLQKVADDEKFGSDPRDGFAALPAHLMPKGYGAGNAAPTNAAAPAGAPASAGNPHAGW